MQTFIDIEDQQLNKLLFYTHAKNGTEAITKIIQPKSCKLILNLTK